MKSAKPKNFRMPIYFKRSLKLLTKNRQAILALLIGILITLPTALYLAEKQKNDNPEKLTTRQEEAPKSDVKNTDGIQPAPTTPAAPSNTTPAAPSNTTPAPTTPAAPSAPTKKEPYTFTFASGTRSAQWYAGGTFFPGNDYSDEWLSLTSKADATGFLNFRFSYNCSSGDACPAILLQGSTDGQNWITYRNLTKSLAYPNNYGTYDYPVLYPYYRLLLAIGSCSSNACPPPTPPFVITYELSATGYFYY